MKTLIWSQHPTLLIREVKILIEEAKKSQHTVHYTIDMAMHQAREQKPL